MFKHTVIMIAMVVALYGCTSNGQDSLETYKSPEIIFEPTSEYSLDTSKLDDLHEETLEGLLSSQIYANIDEYGNLELTFDESEANAVVIMSENWSAVADLAEITQAYKDIATSQEQLIKVKDQTILQLQQLVLLQQSSKDIYKENFALANNLYLQENRIRKREKVFSDIRYCATVVGIIAVGVL